MRLARASFHRGQSRSPARNDVGRHGIPVPLGAITANGSRVEGRGSEADFFSTCHGVPPGCVGWTCFYEVAGAYHRTPLNACARGPVCRDAGPTVGKGGRAYLGDVERLSLKPGEIPYCDRRISRSSRVAVTQLANVEALVWNRTCVDVRRSTKAMSVHASVWLHSRGIADDGLWRRMRAIGRWIRRAACALRGHDMWLRREHDRIFLECLGCGHQTPGWHIAVRRANRVAPRGTTRVVPMNAHRVTRGTTSRCA